MGLFICHILFLSLTTISPWKKTHNVLCVWKVPSSHSQFMETPARDFQGKWEGGRGSLSLASSSVFLGGRVVRSFLSTNDKLGRGSNQYSTGSDVIMPAWQQCLNDALLSDLEFLPKCHWCDAITSYVISGMRASLLLSPGKFPHLAAGDPASAGGGGGLAILLGGHLSKSQSCFVYKFWRYRTVICFPSEILLSVFLAY